MLASGLDPAALVLVGAALAFVFLPLPVFLGTLWTCVAASSAHEYFELLRALMAPEERRLYLVARGLLYAASPLPCPQIASS